MKYFLATILFASPLLTYAQTPVSSTTAMIQMVAPATTTPATTTQTNTAIAVAAVNVSNVQLIKNSTSSYTVTFTLFNTGETQRGVHYLILLTNEDGDIIRTHSFDTELVLEKNKTVSVSETITIPKGLTGTYVIHVRALTEAGLPLGSTVAGKVTIKETPLLQLLNCTTDQEGYTLNQILQVTCDVKELKKGALTSMDAGGGYVVSGDVFYANEPKRSATALAEIQNGKATLPLQGLSTPGTYTIRARIQERGGAPVGKEESTLFVIQGTKAIILNSLLNKDMYQKGESALATLALKIISEGTSTPLVLINTLSGEKSTCALPVVQEVAGRSALRVEFPVTSDCLNPVLTTEIKDDKNNVIATSSVSYKSPVRNDALKNPTPSVNEKDKMVYGGVGAFGLLVGLLSVFIARRRVVAVVTP
jgi:hypothetical protein